MGDLRELVRQRVWLVKIGRATKSAEETADDILNLIVEECAKIAQDSWGPSADTAAEIRKLAQKR
jgi:hypothetical protein